MKEPVLTLLASHLRAWFGAKGFGIVVAAALAPVLLTGAWVSTHQADLAITNPEWDLATPEDGDAVTFTATLSNPGDKPVGAFDATIQIDRLVAGLDGGVRRTPEDSKTFEVDGLAPGETRTLEFTWNATPGVFLALTEADGADNLPEIEEENNWRWRIFTVNYADPSGENPPREPGGLTGNATANATADVAVTGLRWIPANLTGGAPAAAEATVQNRGPHALDNATVVVQLGQGSGENFFTQREQKTQVSIGPNGTTTVALQWTTQPGVYWVRAYVDVGNATHDPNAGNNHLAEAFKIDPQVAGDMEKPEAPERATIKRFYLDVLSLLHLRILIPFIGLFYAGGVLADERERGNLTHLLTRPLERWTIPVTKFLAGYVVAAVALVVGLLATYALLFGTTPQQDVGFLTTPLIASLIALFAYGAFFTLLGVLVERPYLIGVALVLGWETVAGTLVPWVQNLTLSHHLITAINGWPLDQGFLWWPTDPAGAASLRGILLAGLAFLLAAAGTMKRKEFEV